jgi:uncharacterized alpha-E superfamily protein
LLEYSDSIMTYRRRYFARPELPATLDLLLADVTNPRSLAFQLNALGAHLADLPGSVDDQPEFRKCSEVRATMAAADLWALGEAARNGHPRQLDDLLGTLIAGCCAISDMLTLHYFSHALPKAS